MPVFKKPRKKVIAQFFFTILFFNLMCSFRVSAQPNNTALDLSLPLEQCWSSQRTPSNNSYFIASDNKVITGNLSSEVLLLPFSNRSLEYFNIINGHRIWISDLGGEIVSKPLVTDKEIYLIVKIEENYFLRNLSKTTGIVNWQTKINLPEAGDPEVFLYLFEDRIIIVTQRGDGYALKKENGNVLWQSRISAKLTSIPALEAGLIAIGDADNKLLIISALDGLKLKEFKTISPVTTIVFQTNDELVAGDKTGNVFAIDLSANNKMWKIRNGAGISAINRSEEGLLISSLDNFVYLVLPKNGKILWKRRLPGRILYKPLVFDKYAVITNLYDSNAVFIALKTGKTINQIVFERGNYFTNNILLEGNLLVFSNLSGLNAYALFPGACKSD